jgi:hypothetical protein
MEAGNQNDSRNRRWAVRSTPQRCVRFVCRKGTLGVGVNLLARVVDVSESGARLGLITAVAVKDEVEITIEGRCGPVLKRLGNIVWVRPQDDGTFLAGVHFQHTLSYSEIQEIKQFS